MLCLTWSYYASSTHGSIAWVNERGEGGWQRTNIACLPKQGHGCLNQRARAQRADGDEWGGGCNGDDDDEDNGDDD